MMTLLALLASTAQPIPHGGYDGYWNSTGSRKVILELFGDLICPDTKASWPTSAAQARTRLTVSPVLYHPVSQFVLTRWQ